MGQFFESRTTEQGKAYSLYFQGVIMLFLVALLAGLLGGFLFQKISTSNQKTNQDPGPFQSSLELQDEEHTLTALVAKNSPGVVSIIAKKQITAIQGGFPFFFLPLQEKKESSEPQKVGSGSGFFVSSDGIIVTNKHVVADEKAEYTVLMTGNDEELKATVLARDPVNDIAFLKVLGKDFPALTLGDSDTLEVGETAIAIGNSLGEFANSVSRGIISGKQRSLTAGNVYGETEQLSGIIQTDAAINPGNSGGPLFNLRGEVIGVNVAVAQGAENIGFALPINQVKVRLMGLQKNGRIVVPYMGVRYVVISETLQKEHDLPFAYGALVLRGKEITDFAVAPGSPADIAGIKENDILLTIDGKKITTENVLAEELGKKNPGDKVTFDIWTAGKEKKGVNIILEERKAE
jgi:serine protease Do